MSYDAAYYKRWREANRDKLSANDARWRTANPEKRKQVCRRYRSANLSKEKAYKKTYRVTHLEECRKRKHKWDIANRDVNAAREARRRTRKTNAGGSYTVDEWNTLKAFYGNRCLCCGKQEPEVKLTADHVIPVAKGGNSNIDNIQPLCKSCNSMKHTDHTDFRKDTL